jgi:hypothetical protein
MPKRKYNSKPSYHREDDVHMGRLTAKGRTDSVSAEYGPAGHESHARSEYHRTMMRMKEDSHMINEDFGAPALCPREVIDKEWGYQRHYVMEGQIRDLYGAVSATMAEDGEDLRKELKPTNW